MSGWKLVFTDSYEKRARRFLRKYPELLKQYTKTLELLELNPKHPSLRLHRLKGRLRGLHSAAITISYRITIEIQIKGATNVPIDVGTHGDV